MRGQDVRYPPRAPWGNRWTEAQSRVIGHVCLVSGDKSDRPKGQLFGSKGELIRSPPHQLQLFASIFQDGRLPEEPALLNSLADSFTF